MIKTNKAIKKNEINNHKIYKKRSKKRLEYFSLYIYRVLKQIHPNLGISKKSSSIMNSFIYDMFDKICSEARKLAIYGKKKIIVSREIQTSIKLIFPRELAKNAVMWGTKALCIYVKSLS